MPILFPQLGRLRFELLNLNLKFKKIWWKSFRHISSYQMLIYYKAINYATALENGKSILARSCKRTDALNSTFIQAHSSKIFEICWEKDQKYFVISCISVWQLSHKKLANFEKIVFRTSNQINEKTGFRNFSGCIKHKIWNYELYK